MISVASSSSDEPSPHEQRGTLIWAEEFDTPLDLTTSQHVGRWRAGSQWGNSDLGYVDFAGTSWNINPIQHPRHSPFSVENGILTIAVTRTSEDLISDIESTVGKDKAPKWSGGMLVTDWRRISFKHGYFEIRARFPTPGRGMFPAIWLYVANGRTVNNPAKSGAEIDLVEILGHETGRPWVTTVHCRDWQGNGDQVEIGRFDTDTRDWHVYGFDWRPDKLRFFRDGVPAGELAGAKASWFDVNMAIHLNFTVDSPHIMKKGRGTDETTPDRMEMQVDYVRVYSHL
ncbi:MAG: glycoside hydrolase family 16 protein [Rhodospirillales bacterium]|nr:glycoside hydrolase family 16 protein [Rhodospirillales bacterium]